MDKVFHKKWILIWHIPFHAHSPELWLNHVDYVKKEMSDQIMEEFFGTKILQIFFPTPKDEMRIEIHEIILSNNGYDKFDIMLQDTKISAQQVLERLKEVLDVEK